MPLHIVSINSGSNGNCYYVGNENSAILVDVGLSCRQIELRMFDLNLSMAAVKAIFISHEHSDHIKGVTVLAKKYGLPVYASEGTVKAGRLKLSQLSFLEDRTPIQVGDLEVIPFKKLHDAADAYSFNVSGEGKTIGVYTDIGQVCENLIGHFRLCDAVILEANYDDELLKNGSYPYYLKQRISGGMGHLSNDKALTLVNEHSSINLKLILLAHLSKENNRPELVQELFEKNTQGKEIVVLSRYESSTIYKI